MSINIPVGTEIAEYYTVLEVKRGKVPSTMSEYVRDALIIELDSKYENQSRLSIYTLKGPMPPAGQWSFLVPDDLSGVRVKKSWTPLRVNPPCGAMEYEARTSQGTRVTVVHMMAASKTVLVHAEVRWVGFPGFNRFFVGCKPGMKERTEALLEVGLSLCK